MGVKIFLGEPPPHVKQWIIDHYGPTPPPVSSKITITYENGDTLEVDGPLTSSNIGPTADIVSITVPDGAVISNEPNLFIECVKLSEITFGDNTTVPDDIESKVQNWSLGLDAEGNTHLVVLYYGNGVVVINDADDSSGERGFKVDWNKFVGWLEDFDNSSLPEPGKCIIVPYKVDPNGEAVDTEWMILGYNKDIPRFVKYKNGNTRVYMDVLPGNQLLATFEGANVYSTKDGSGSVLGTVTGVGGTSFTFGNNNTYSVPGRITVNGTNYTFCGYNVTLQSKYGLVAKFNDSLYECPQFDSQNRNDWKTSEIREWLNGTNAVSTQKWYRVSDGSWASATGTIVGLLGRLTDQNFMENIIPTVTRTWVYPNWRDGTEVTEITPETIADRKLTHHLADKFRLLGVGEINCYGDNTNNYYPDGGALIDNSVTPDIRGFDTSRFGDVFNETDVYTGEKSRKRRLMKEDGTKGSAYNWWVRSARSDGSSYVGCVDGIGRVGYNGASCDLAVLPVCLIG